MRKHKELKGYKISHLTLLHRIQDTYYPRMKKNYHNGSLSPLLDRNGNPSVGIIINYLTKCDCGNITEKAYHDIMRGNTICCNEPGCAFATKRIRRNPNPANTFFKDHSGKKYGHLTLIKRMENKVYLVKNHVSGKIVKSYEPRYWVRCDCGKECEKRMSYIAYERKDRKSLRSIDPNAPGVNCGRWTECPYSLHNYKKKKGLK